MYTNQTSMHISCEGIFSLHQYLVVSCDMTDSSNWERWSILPTFSMKTLMMSWKSCDSWVFAIKIWRNLYVRRAPCHWRISFSIERMAEVQNLHPQREGKIWSSYFAKVILVTFSTILFMWVLLQPIQRLQQTFKYNSKIKQALLKLFCHCFTVT